MGAAMEGGIGGHRNFSNSMDVAKIMQLYTKEIMEIDNISEKHSVTLILVILRAEGNRRE
jgi:hypothetical protein